MAPTPLSTLPALLSSLTQSITSALEATTKLDELEPATGGISLLDVKNDLLLSYLQHLVFLILVKIRHAHDSSRATDSIVPATVSSDDVAKKLVELRLYLEKGVGPLEGALKYQIENLLQAAAEADRAAQGGGSSARKHTKKPAKQRTGFEDESDLASSASGSDDDDDDDDAPEEDDGTHGSSHLAAFLKPTTSTSTATTRHTGLVDPTSSAPYKPPMRRRALMPSTDASTLPKTSQPAAAIRGSRNPTRAHAVEDYLLHEAPNAPPVAQPSIGTTLRASGRTVLSQRERDDAAKRREYEETHLVRLPVLSKKERAKRGETVGSGKKRMAFGGEEFRELGSGVDRIDRMVRKRKEGGSGRGDGVKAMLDRSRKRGAEGMAGGGAREQVGERFAKKVRLMEKGRGR